MPDPPGFDVSDAPASSAPPTIPCTRRRPFGLDPDGDDYDERARRKARQEVVESIGPARFTNRELSRLDFGARLLDLAEDDRRAPARAGEVHGDLLRDARRVLPGAGVGAGGPGGAPAVTTRSDDGLRPAEQLRAIREPGRSAGRPPGPDLPRPPGAPAGRRRGPAVGLVVARRRRPALPGRRLPPGDVPGAHPPGRRHRATPSPTSRTCRSTWSSRWATRSPASGASPG